MNVLSECNVEQVCASLRHDGYVVVKGVVPKGELDELASRLHAVYQQAKTSNDLFRGGGTFSGHLNCFPGEHSRFVYDAVADRGIVDVARAFDAAKADTVRVTMNYNLPHSHNQHFHSDGLFVERFMIINVAVVDITSENGPMDVIPGSQREFHKFWQYAWDRMYRRAVPVCMNKGDVMIRFSTMWHRGTKNRTDQVRPMMSLTFGEDSAPRSDAFESEIVFEPNWYGTSRKDEIRERVFATAPVVYSTMRFGRSLVGNKGYDHW